MNALLNLVNYQRDNPGKIRKFLIIFDDIIYDTISNKKLH